jgi:amino acid adenylation domain-containing protein
MQQTLEGFRLSPQQARLWWLQQQCHAYRSYCSLLIEGELDRAALDRAMQEIIARNEMYRTHFRRLPGVAMPMQVIAPTPSCVCEQHDLSQHEQTAQLEALIQKQLAVPVDLEQGVPCHTLLVTLDPQKNVLLIFFHALYADRQTLYAFARELAALYQTNSSQEQEVVQYVQFSEWQHTLLEEEQEAAERAFWRAKNLADLSTLSLPFAQDNGLDRSFTPAVFSMVLDPVVASNMTTFLERFPYTPAVLLLACWCVQIWRLTERAELLIGLGVDSRVYEELAETAGLLAKYLPLTCRLSAEQRFEEVLAQIAANYTELCALQSYFTSEDLEGVGHASRSSRACLYPFGFDFTVLPGTYHAGATTFTVQQCYACHEPFKIKLAAVQTASALRLEFHYATECFDASAVERLAGQFQALLESAIRQPQACIDDLELLPPAERRQILFALNQTQAPYPEKACMQHLFETQASRTPDSVAVQSDEHQLTYAALDVHANQLARHLQTLHVGPEVLVGIYFAHSLELAVGILGVLKAGGAYLPLDRHYPRERLTYIIDDARVAVVLTRSDMQSDISYHAQIVCLDTDWSRIAQQDRTSPLIDVSPANLAYVIYTSGSTGQPKGVMVPHRGLVHYVDWACRYYASDRAGGSPVHSSLAFDLTITSLFPALCSGQRVVMVPDEQGIEGLGAVLREGPDFSLVKLTPAHLNMLNHYLEADEFVGAAQALVIGGEALYRENLLPWRHPGMTTRLINEYGPTETVVGCCIYEVPIVEELPSTIPIGRPIPNTELYLLDTRLRPVPIGVPGELYIGGIGVGLGYLGRPDLTAEHFIPHPFSQQPGARLYKTGDVARYISSDGVLEYLGRSDHQVKLRGYRIELGEIEAHLRRLQQVRDAVVILRTDASGNPLLVGYVVPNQQQVLTSETLRTALSLSLPEYMVPSAFVFLKDLPLTTNGKVNRQALPEPTFESESSRYVPPRTPLEEILVGIWEEVLKVKPIGCRDNFFQLGGHSLLATQVIARLRRTFKIEIAVRSLFDALTVEGLALQVEQALHQQVSVLVPPLVSTERTADPPLSFAQQRLWFLDQLEPGGTTYLIPHALYMRGALDATVLERSLEELVRRHESLRTTFFVRADQPVQVIHPAGRFYLPLIDLSSLAEDARERVSLQLVRQEAQRPCDLTRGPLLRAFLLRLQDQEHIFLITAHHIISDAWSGELLIRELTELYQAFVAGEPSPLSPLPIQYADFALWQRQWLQGAVLEAQLDYWKRQLAGVEVLELPTDYPRPPIQTFRGASSSVLLPSSLYEALLALCRREGVTLFMALLAAWQVVLARYSGQTDICVGTPIANRTRAELEGLIGFFVNTLVMRTDLTGNPTFAEVLERVREVALGAYTHQDVPFELLVEILQPERDLSRSPFFQVMFVLQNRVESTPSPQGFIVNSVQTGDVVAKFDLALAVAESEQGLRCGIEYNIDLFKESTIERMLGHLLTLLEAVTTQSTVPLSHVSLLTTSERTALQAISTGPQGRWPQEQQGPLLLHRLIETQVDRTPDAVAVQSEEGQLTYAALDARANQLASTLRQRGVGPETLVGLAVDRCLWLHIGLLAILKAGGAYVPLELSYPDSRLALMLEQSGAGLVLTTQEQQARFEAMAQGVPRDVLVLASSGEQEWRNPSQLRLSISMEGEHLAYVIFTSGSTGTPKGAMNTHDGICNRLLWMQERYGLMGQDRVLHKTPIGFDVSVWELFWPLITGACVVLARAGGQRESRYLAEVIREQEITTLHFVPSLLQVFVEEEEVGRCRSVQRVICSGEALSWNVIQRCEQRWGAALYNLYGPTEAAVDVSEWAVKREEEGSGGGVPIGRAIRNLALYVLDGQQEEVPIGVAGELYIGGRGVGRGYVGRPEWTGERYVPDNQSGRAGGRLYRTGDRARWNEEGELEYLGRMDQQVKIRGVRVELGEIEAVIEGMEGVRGSAVVSKKEAGGGARLVAYVVGEVRVGEIKAYVRARLPEALMPGQIVLEEHLPLTPNGKIDRRALTQRKDLLETSEAETIIPRNQIEALLSTLWCDLLERPQIGMQENFFEAGGHSLLATRLISRVRAVLGVELPLRKLFEEPTIAGFALLIENELRREQGRSTIALPVPVDRTQDLPLSFAQQRLWFLDQLEPGNVAYVLSIAVRLQGMLHLQALEDSLGELVRRHEILRTVFRMKSSVPVQIILPAETTVALPIFDAGHLPPEQRLTVAREIVQQEQCQPFDLAKGPLLRVMLVRLDADEHVLVISMHHIISDGWSIDVLVRELNSLYTASLAQRPSPLPDLAIQYADFACWQRQWLQGEVLQEQLAYWMRQLRGCTPLRLPTDHPRPTRVSYRGASHFFELPADLVEALYSLGRREGVTLFMSLLAAFQTLLYRYTGQTDITVGTDIANRTYIETEALIGFFVNLLVLRNNLHGAPSFQEVLHNTREMVLSAYAHQDTPFELLVEQLLPEQMLDRMPLVQVLFVLQNQPLAQAQLPGLQLSPFQGSEVESAKFDLALFITEGDGLHGVVRYSRDLFEAQTIATMISRFETLLRHIVASPETSIDVLDFYTETEKERQAQVSKDSLRKLRTAKGKAIQFPSSDAYD